MIKFKKDKCIACRICEVVCSMEHEGEVNTRKARIRYRDDWPHVGKVDYCRHCSKKPCIDACAFEALMIGEDGMVLLNEKLCTSCKECIKACPFGELPSDGKYPLFCDTCKGKYQCINWCPTKALIR